MAWNPHSKVSHLRGRIGRRAMPQLLRTVSMPTRFPSANTEGSLLACHASGCEIAANLTDQAELRGSYRPIAAGRDRQRTAKSGRSIFKKCNISDMASLMGWAPVDWGKHQIWVDTSCYLSPLLACRRSRELELVVSACPSTRHLKISVSWLRPSLALPLIRLVEFVMWAV